MTKRRGVEPPGATPPRDVVLEGVPSLTPPGPGRVTSPPSPHSDLGRDLAAWLEDLVADLSDEDALVGGLNWHRREARKWLRTIRGT